MSTFISCIDQGHLILFALRSAIEVLIRSIFSFLVFSKENYKNPRLTESHTKYCSYLLSHRIVPVDGFLICSDPIASDVVQWLGYVTFTHGARVQFPASEHYYHVSTHLLHWTQYSCPNEKKNILKRTRWVFHYWFTESAARLESIHPTQEEWGGHPSSFTGFPPFNKNHEVNKTTDEKSRRSDN